MTSSCYRSLVILAGWIGIVAMCNPSAMAAATAFYVAPDGAAEGDGSESRPWDLRTALAHPPSVLPGDIIFVREGKYQGPFTSRLTGVEGSPITVAGVPGARVTLEGCHCPDAVLSVEGAWTVYRDFEVANTNPDRSSDRVRGPGVWVMGPNTVFANLVVHDNNQGFSFWTPAVDAELHGNLIFDNGWDAPDRGHGHAIYTQNRTGIKRIANNIVFDQFGDGLHAYGTEDADLNNFRIEGNIFFNNGSLSKTTGFARNILLGGGKLSLDSHVTQNVTYYPVDQKQGDNNIGYRAGTKNAAVTGNTFVGGNLAVIAPQELRLSGNYLYLNVPVVVRLAYPDNQYVSQKPAKNAVFVRKNSFQPGRVHVAILNWEGLKEAAADISPAGLNPGDCYEVRNAEDYYGRPVRGRYHGEPVMLPLTGWWKRETAGWQSPKPALPEFGAFVVSAAPCEEPAPRADPPPTPEDMPIDQRKGDGLATSWSYVRRALRDGGLR